MNLFNNCNSPTSNELWNFVLFTKSMYFQDYFDVPVPATGTVTLAKPVDFEKIQSLSVKIMAKVSVQYVEQ